MSHEDPPAAGAPAAARAKGARAANLLQPRWVAFRVRSPHSTRDHLPPWSAAFAVLAVLVGCGREAAVGGGARFQRLELEPIETPGEGAEARSVARFEPGREPESWEGEAVMRGVRAVQGAPGQAPPALIIDQPGPKSLARELQIDPRSVHEVAVTLACSGPQTLEAILMRDDAEIARSRAEDVQSSPSGARVVLDLPWPPPQAETCDRLVLRFTGESKRIGLMEVELVERPPSALANDDLPEALIPVAEDLRRGHWISPQRSLRARARKRAGATLSLAWSQPLKSSFAPGGILRITAVDGSGGQQVQRVALELQGRRPQWREVRMPLDRLNDGEVEIALYLDVGKGQDAICAVSEVGLLSDGEQFLPSVLLITSDTHRGDHLGAMDLGVEVKTPTLDALAQRGVLFTNCFSPTNSTNPSHASLLTGIHPRDTGILNNNTRLAATAQTLPERFRDAGYRTWAVVSARHLLDDMSGLGQGFDRMEAPKREARGAEETLEVLDGWLEAAGDEPAFVWLHLFDVHSPYQPPGRFDRMYYPPGKDPYDPSLPDHGVRAEILQREHKGVRDLEFSRAQYRGEVSYLDEQLREVLDRRRFREGVVAFLADHGESLGEHGIWFGHAGLYPGTIHIPLILSWPGAPAGARVDAPAIHMDLGRTLLDLAGLERESFPGRDLRELAGEASSEAVRKAVSQPRFALGHAREASITVGSHHMILQMRGFHGIVLEKPRRAHEVELYDLARDPGCDHNLVDEQPERARRMRALLVQWLQEAQPLGLIADKSNDPELLRGLAQLGYAMDDGGTGPARASLWQEDDCDWCRRFR